MAKRRKGIGRTTPSTRGGWYRLIREAQIEGGYREAVGISRAQFASPFEVKSEQAIAWAHAQAIDVEAHLLATLTLVKRQAAEFEYRVRETLADLSFAGYALKEVDLESGCRVVDRESGLHVFIARGDRWWPAAKSKSKFMVDGHTTGARLLSPELAHTYVRLLHLGAEVAAAMSKVAAELSEESS